MVSMARKGSMFMLAFNSGMGIMMYLASIIFPTNTPTVNTYDTNSSLILSITDVFNSQTGILSLVLTAGLVSLFAFSALMATVKTMALFYSLNGVLAAYYISQLHIGLIWTAPIMLLIGVNTFIAISEYVARQQNT